MGCERSTEAPSRRLCAHARRGWRPLLPAAVLRGVRRNVRAGAQRDHGGGPAAVMPRSSCRDARRHRGADLPPGRDRPQRRPGGPPGDELDRPDRRRARRRRSGHARRAALAPARPDRADRGPARRSRAGGCGLGRRRRAGRPARCRAAGGARYVLSVQSDRTYTQVTQPGHRRRGAAALRLARPVAGTIPCRRSLRVPASGRVTIGSALLPGRPRCPAAPTRPGHRGSRCSSRRASSRVRRTRR